MAKKFEIDLTPQNEEWLNQIPNHDKNKEMILNKLIEVSIQDGTLLEVISNSLTVADLQKFKTNYTKMQKKRNSCLEHLEVQPAIIKKREQSDEYEEDEQEEVEEKQEEEPKPKKQTFGSGFSEDEF